MSRIIYGYKIKNGQVVIDEKEAEVIKKIFESYLAGNSLQKSADLAEVDKSHGNVKRILINKRYLGDEHYPSIIDQKSFDKAGEMLNDRAKALGRVYHKEEVKRKIPSKFIYKEEEVFPRDPFERATHQYSQIEVIGDE